MHAVGGADEFGAMAQAKMSSGYDCGMAANCLQDDGSGYFVPTIGHGSLAYHAGASGPWALKHSLDWLAGATSRRVPPSHARLSPSPPSVEVPSTPAPAATPTWQSKPPKPPPPPKPPVCTGFATQHAFLQHCASADDCPSEATFCACCREYGRRTEWAEACVAFCGQEVFAPPRPAVPKPTSDYSSWRIDDFGRTELPPPNGPPTAIGPYFDQPALSLVGDAAVVLGDCYNIDLRSSQILDRAGSMVGTRACLLPPVTRKLYGSDANLHLNLSVCSSSVAPFHVHDTQPNQVTLMLANCTGEADVVFYDDVEPQTLQEEGCSFAPPPAIRPRCPPPCTPPLRMPKSNSRSRPRDAA